MTESTRRLLLNPGWVREANGRRRGRLRGGGRHKGRLVAVINLNQWMASRVYRKHNHATSVICYGREAGVREGVYGYVPKRDGNIPRETATKAKSNHEHPSLCTNVLGRCRGRLVTNLERIRSEVLNHFAPLKTKTQA